MSTPLFDLPAEPRSNLQQSLNTTTFVDNMRLPVHRWFRYSAGFSGRWVEEVIDASGATGVFDPYAGSGTTVLAAESRRLPALGADVHPFVGRVARAKLAWRADPDELMLRARAVLAEVEQERNVEMPRSALIPKCFPDTAALTNLLRIRDAVERQRAGDDLDELLWLAMVSIIRMCSPAGTAQWQYVLPNATKSRVAEPRAAFFSRVELFAEDMRQMAPLLDSPPGQILTTDARTLKGVEDDVADLVVTSPPYANNFDYADATRLEQSFLGEVEGWSDLAPLRKALVKSATQHMGGWDPAEALESSLIEPIRAELLAVYEELGEVRRTKGGNKRYDLMVAGYFYDSAQVWKALRRVTREGGKVCFVVGDSAPYGVHVPVERWLGELAQASGFGEWRFEKLRDRNLKWKNRKHNHPLHEGRLWIEA